MLIWQGIFSVLNCCLVDLPNRFSDECISTLCASSSDVCAAWQMETSSVASLRVRSSFFSLSFTPEVLILACWYANAVWLALMWGVSRAVLSKPFQTKTQHVKNDCRKSSGSVESKIKVKNWMNTNIRVRKIIYIFIKMYYWVQNSNLVPNRLFCFWCSLVKISTCLPSSFVILSNVHRWLSRCNPKRSLRRQIIYSITSCMAEAYWGMSNNCNWPNMSLWDESKCFSSSNALHISGLDPLLEEWRLLRVTFLRTSQQHTDALWQQSDNWSVLCTQTQWSSGRIPRKLLQTICFMMRFKGGILYWVVAGVAKVC